MNIKNIHVNLLLKSTIMISSGLFFILVGILIQQNLKPTETQSISGIDYTEVNRPTDTEFTSVSGNISNISGNSLVLTLPTQKQIKVTITDETVIEKYTQKKQEEMQTQSKQIDEETNLPIPAFSIEKLSRNSLTKDLQVVVEANDNVIGVSSIQATKITIYE
jgi:hypothetical protein